MKTFEEFISEIYPQAVSQYEVYKLWMSGPEKLIGRKVRSIRSGFSCSYPNYTDMIISFVSSNPQEWKAMKLSPVAGEEYKSKNGWMLNEPPWESFIFID